MVWIVLAALGVPLWLCAAALLTLLARNRKLRGRAGNLPVRLRAHGSTRWVRGHGLWVHDVFAFRGSPAMWSEDLIGVTGAASRGVAGPDEVKKLRRLGEHPAIVVLTSDGGAPVEVAVPADRAVELMGPFAEDTVHP